MQWPMHKKMVHVHHLQAYEAEKEKAMEDRQENMDTPDVPSPSGGDVPPNPGNMGQTHGGRKPFANRDDVHPKLRKYPNMVNVENPGESMGEERKQDIIENTIRKHGEHNPPARDPGENPVTSTRDPDRIRQASDEK